MAVAGLFIFGYTLLTDMPDLNDPDFGDTPSGIPLALGVFFAGFVILGIGAIGRAMSKRYRPQAPASRVRRQAPVDRAGGRRSTAPAGR